jgi:GNAT superfamily N-acetyltransferase
MNPAERPVRRLSSVDASSLAQLAEVLVDCVEGGASVSFMWPFTTARALAFWQRVADDVVAGRRLLLVAEDAAGICGTVQLALDLPENQPHRADLAKMLVHRRARNRGVGAALLRAAEAAASEHGRSLLVLDTVSGSPASRLYRRMGWRPAGEIPGYAHWPDGRPCPTTFYYRELA